MATAVIGATGRVGSEIVRGVLDDPPRARCAPREPITFRVTAERQFLGHLTGAGILAGEAELLITREWAILAGENDYTTGTFQQITGRPPRPVTGFLHEHRGEFA